MKNKNFNTKAIHIGNSPDEETGAVTSPIHFSSTFKQNEVGVHKGYDYSRAGNPTRERFEKNISLRSNKVVRTVNVIAKSTFNLRRIESKSQHAQSECIMILVIRPPFNQADSRIDSAAQLYTKSIPQSNPSSRSTV